MTMCTLYKYGQ